MSSAQEQIVHTIIEGFKEQRIDALDWLRHKILGALINERNVQDKIDEADKIIIRTWRDALTKEYNRAESAEAELKRTRAALDIAREYLDNHSDCVDGDYGVPAPNDAMKCLAEINEAMEKR